MKCYVINLDRSPDRLTAFTMESAKSGMAFERFSAIDGKLVSEEQLAAERAARFELQPINRFETALYLSHRTVWQKFADSGEAMCAIFEDDVVLAPNIMAAFALISTLSDQFDVVKLETTKRKVVIARAALAQSDDFLLSVLKSWHGGAAGYVLSRRGALKLLDKTTKLADPVDQVIFNPLSSVSRTLRILQLVPAVAIQIQFSARQGIIVPQTTAGRDQAVRFGIRHGVWIDVRRAFKRLATGMRFKWLAQQRENRQLRVNFAPGKSGNIPNGLTTSQQVDRT